MNRTHDAWYRELSVWVPVALVALGLGVPVESGALTVEDQKVIASAPQINDNLGVGIAADGTRLVVGAPGVDIPTVHAPGKAYVFELESGVWTEKAVLQASDGENNNLFGFSVAVSGDRILVGAHNTDDYPATTSQEAGAVYVFERDAGGTWIQVAKLIASDPVSLNAHFGASVDLDGDWAVIMATRADNQGAAYLFHRDPGGTWSEVSKHSGSDPQPFGFGDGEVSISGDYAMVGARNNSPQGVVYVFKRTGSSWTEVQKLEPSDAASTSFGIHVSVSGDRAIVGSFGPAYIYERDPGTGTWTEVATVSGARNEVSIHGDRALVRAAGIQHIWVYERDTLGSWNQVDTLTKSDSDPVGLRNFLTANWAFSGSNPADLAELATGPINNAGAVYAFNLTTTVDVIGDVSASCGGDLLGVTVDLDLDPDDEDAVMLSTTTDANGHYEFLGVPQSAAATLSIVVPLGYRATDPDPAVQFVSDGTVFSLACITASLDEARSMGYWKHQAKVYFKGQGHAQESEADITSNLPLEMFNHFHNNALNPIKVEDVTYMEGPVPIDLATMHATLSVKNAPMLERAKQQYLVLLLNLASEKILPTTEVSTDEATASQTIQQVADLITDGEYEEAKNICDTINHGQLLDGGVIDQGSYQTIVYAPQPGAALLGSFPNPLQRATTVSYTLTEPGAVAIRVYDVQGRLVRKLLTGVVEAGKHRVVWDGRDASGRSVANGSYFVRIKTPYEMRSQKLVVMR